MTRIQREGLLRRLWPEQPPGIVAWIEDGWDYSVVAWSRAPDESPAFGVRMARSRRNAWRLRRERGLVMRLDGSPVQLVKYEYEEKAFGVVRYPWIPGRPLGSSLSPMVAGQLAEFLTWLHQHFPSPSRRSQWSKVRQYWHQTVIKEALPLFSVKERRAINEWFRQEAELLDASDWVPGLLHGDFTKDNILVEDGRVSGVIDFTDWRVGDPAFDYSGLQGWEAIVPEGDQNFRQRVALYHFQQPFWGLLHSLEVGDVQASEKAVNQIRRNLWAR